MSIKSNILRVFSANLLTLLSGVLIGFIVPAVLSLEGYAYVKTYLLYVGYLGFLHLGFIDGMYIKYGGKNIVDINKGILKAEHRVFNIIQMVATFIFILIAYLSHDFIIFILALSIIPINTSAFHKLFYQSTGQFKRFANISYIYTLIYLSINMILAFVLKSDNYKLYCFASLIGHIITFFILEFNFKRDFRNIKAVYDNSIWNNIKVGFIILIANLGVVIVNAADLWFVKFGFNSSEFAYYSFAISMLNIINVMIMSVSVTFYNYLAQDENKEKIKILKINFIVVGNFFSLAYFAFAMIVNVFLKKYIPSLSIIAISFAGFPYIIAIKGLFINLYRARKDEKKYLKVMLSMVVVAIIYNFIAIIIFKTPEAIALATLSAFITWYLYSGYDFEYLNINKKEIVYLFIMTGGFLVTSNYFNWLTGGIIYLLIFTLSVLIFYKKETVMLITKRKLGNRSV